MVSTGFRIAAGRRELQKDAISPPHQLEFPHAYRRLSGNFHYVSRKITALDATMKVF
jgi:hypothetical protein